MKKKLLSRGLMGVPLGIALGFGITLVISIYVGDGCFYPVTPELIDTTGNELRAVVVQTVLCGIMGSGFAMASLIWEMDSWSLAKQSGIYFAIACAIMFPIAYGANWMKHSIGGVLSYVCIFIGIFVFAWITQYLAWRRRIKKIDDSVKKSNSAT